jgi:hypothetical protein
LTTTTLPFQVGEPLQYRGIVIAPLFPRRDPVARYLTLDGALPRGLSVTEATAAGTVPELAVANPLAEDVLLYDGEELVGAMQNRILNVTVLVAARSTLTIPVSCVEEGRWHSVSASFAPAAHIAHAELRRAKSVALSLAQQELAGEAIVQQEVWSSVRETLGRLGVDSPTTANRDAFEARAPELADLEPAFEAAPGQCGTVLGLGDTLCLDVVSRPDAFATLWPKLRAGYLLDALDRLDGRATPTARLLGFVDEVADAPVLRAPSVGLGTDLRLRGPGVLGAGLERDGETIQVSGFTADDERPRTTARIARPSRRA